MKPKILIFINTLGFGGAERVVSQLLVHLQKDFEIHLALLTKIIDYDIPKDVKIFDLKQPFNENTIFTFLKLPVLALKLKRYCKKHNITKCVSFLNRPCYISGFMRSWYSFKDKILMCERTHQSTLFKNDTFFYKTVSSFLIKFAYNKADLVLTNSVVMAEDLVENFDIKVPIKVIYNPIDVSAVKLKSLDEPDYFFEPEIFHFISVGGFRKEKNYSLLLEAFAIIKELQVKLIFIGGGDLENELKQKAQQLNLSDKVVFAGFDANPYKYMVRADCLVLSSYVEGFPNVILEALACGKTVISTDCKSGPREILAPHSALNFQILKGFENAEYGIITSVKSPADLAMAMKEVYENKELRNKYENKASKRAEDFDVIKIKDQFKNVFQ